MEGPPAKKQRTTPPPTMPPGPGSVVPYGAPNTQPPVAAPAPPAAATTTTAAPGLAPAPGAAPPAAVEWVLRNLPAERLVALLSSGLARDPALMQEAVDMVARHRAAEAARPPPPPVTFEALAQKALRTLDGDFYRGGGDQMDEGMEIGTDVEAILEAIARQTPASAPWATKKSAVDTFFIVFHEGVDVGEGVGRQVRQSFVMWGRSFLAVLAAFSEDEFARLAADRAFVAAFAAMRRHCRNFAIHDWSEEDIDDVEDPEWLGDVRVNRLEAVGKEQKAADEDMAADEERARRGEQQHGLGFPNGTAGIEARKAPAGYYAPTQNGPIVIE